MDIYFEIKKAEKIEIKSKEDLELIRTYYFSKLGLLPKIYNYAILQKSSECSKILNDLNRIRGIVDRKINDYLNITI